MEHTSETKLLEASKNNINFSKTQWLMYMLTFFAQSTAINYGYSAGASSGAILLARDIKYLRMNRVWEQLIIAGAMPSAAISSLIGAYMSDKFGRRKCLMMACLFYMLGSVISGSASNRESLLAGQLLIGCGFGFTCASAGVYIAECSPAHIRGHLIGVSQPFASAGVLFGSFIAALFSYDKTNGWRYMWGIQGIFGCIQFLALIFLPESPRWLIQKSRRGEAIKSLYRIRNTNHVEEEIDEIQGITYIVNPGGCKLLLRMLQTGPVRRSLIVGCLLQLFAQFSGVTTVTYYSGILIKMAGIGNVTSALWNSVIVNVVGLIFAIIGVWLVDAIGRRVWTIIALLGLFFSSFCLGTTFLMAAIYSPGVTVKGDYTNTTCSTYSNCDDCVRDATCGFCYEDISDAMNSACLPVSDTSPKLTSEVGACNSSLALSKYSMKWAHDYCPVSFSWVAVPSLALFIVFYVAGMGPLPWIINTEIYPQWARSTGNGIGAMIYWICSMIIAASFLSFIGLIHSYGVFYVMASVSLIGSVFCFFFLPETKNKSLEEIEALFS